MALDPEIVRNLYYESARESFASGFSRISGSLINYGALKTDAGQLMVEASNVELIAKQKANALREQFVGAVGNYKMSAAQRGVSVESGSVRANISKSAESLGKYVQAGDIEATMKAGALRSQSKISKIRAQGELVSGVLSGVGSMVSGYGSYKTGQGIPKGNI